jgi:hypothetical protein
MKKFDVLYTSSFKELEKLKMAITELYVKSVSTGLYGRVLVHLERRQAKK